MSPFNDPFSLAGKTVLVTGASSGIGRQAAIACAARGATLVISGRDRARLGEALAALAGAGHRAVAADLTDAAQTDALVETTGAVDGVFVSSGVAQIAPLRLASREHIDRLMEVDFEAPILLVQRLLKRRQIRRGGSIVFNSALAAAVSPAGTAIYSAAKAALDAAARSLALEVGRQGIRVNSLRLGYVQTRLLDELGRAGLNVAEMSSLAPLGLGTVDDAANAVIYLLSDASRWVSRTTFTCDGGLSIRSS